MGRDLSAARRGARGPGTRGGFAAAVRRSGAIRGRRASRSVEAKKSAAIRASQRCCCAALGRAGGSAGGALGGSVIDALAGEVAVEEVVVRALEPHQEDRAACGPPRAVRGRSSGDPPCRCRRRRSRPRWRPARRAAAGHSAPARAGTARAPARGRPAIWAGVPLATRRRALRTAWKPLSECPSSPSRLRSSLPSSESGKRPLPTAASAATAAERPVHDPRPAVAVVRLAPTAPVKAPFRSGASATIPRRASALTTCRMPRSWRCSRRKHGQVSLSSSPAGQPVPCRPCSTSATGCGPRRHRHAESAPEPDRQRPERPRGGDPDAPEVVVPHPGGGGLRGGGEHEGGEGRRQDAGHERGDGRRREETGGRRTSGATLDHRVGVGFRSSRRRRSGGRLGWLGKGGLSFCPCCTRRKRQASPCRASALSPVKRRPRACAPASHRGPWSTSPSGSKREPWQGQSQLRSALFQSSWQPRCVQIGETATRLPSSRRWPATFSPPWRTMSPSPGASSSSARVPRFVRRSPTRRGPNRVPSSASLGAAASGPIRFGSNSPAQVVVAPEDAVGQDHRRRRPAGQAPLGEAGGHQQRVRVRQDPPHVGHAVDGHVVLGRPAVLDRAHAQCSRAKRSSAS